MSSQHKTVSLVPNHLVNGAEIEAFVDTTVGATTHEVLGLATRAIVRLLGERGSCILLDGEPRVVMSTYAPGVSGWAIELEKYPEIRVAIEARAVVSIENVQTDLRLRAVRSQLPVQLRTVAVVPLLLEDRCMGVVLAQSSTTRKMTAEAVATASLIAKLTARLLPTDAAAREQEAFQQRPSQGPELDRRAPVRVLKRSILIIDDDENNSGLVAELLARAGFDTLTAGDGELGVRLARERRPDLILLDVNMPRLDGYGAAHLLSQDPLTRDIPILFVSGAKDLMPRIREMQLEGVDFLTKPFARQELLTRVERSLSRAEANKKVRIEAHIDELTGLGNLRSLRERLQMEQARWQRHEVPVAIVTVDVDKLKRINDTLGHAAGSLALARIGEVLRRDVRETDLAVRYGGDEFVVLLPHATIADGQRFAERVLEHVRQLRSEGTPVSVSIGVAALEGAMTIEAVLERSDAAAYRAKRQGGDRVCLYEPPAPER